MRRKTPIVAFFVTLVPHTAHNWWNKLSLSDINPGLEREISCAKTQKPPSSRESGGLQLIPAPLRIRVELQLPETNDMFANSQESKNGGPHCDSISTRCDISIHRGVLTSLDTASLDAACLDAALTIDCNFPSRRVSYRGSLQPICSLTQGKVIEFDPVGNESPPVRPLHVIKKILP